MSTNHPRQTKADRRENARAEALKLREEAKRREKRNRGFAIGGLAAAVVVLVVAVWLILGSEAKPIAYQGDEAPALADVQAPSTANDLGGIPVGTDLAAGSSAGENPVVVEVVFDYQCPHCANFEQVNSFEINTLLQTGNVEFIFRPVSFMDYASNGKEYSTRAANAAAVVADQAPDKYLPFHNALFANQPTANGMKDEQIADIALEVGVPQAVVDQFVTTVEGSDERTYSRWIAAATEHTATQLGGLSTPTVLINGQKFPGPDQDANLIMQTGGLATAVLAKKAELGLE
ncbi:MAG: thioredoxin domain-containing protein [Actinomycetales bacterium]|nr:thioredoxin domain-containing protein [Actinomycetales bacterium]